MNNVPTPTASSSAYGFSIKLMQFLVVPTFVLDAQGKVLIWNMALERLTGLPAAEVVGTRNHWRAFYRKQRPCLADLIHAGKMGELSALYVESEDPQAHPLAYGIHAENWCNMPHRGVELFLAIDAGPIYDDQGQLIAVVETLRDITLQKQSQTELERLASSDGLTGLLNRRTFDQKLQVACQTACRDHSPLSLLMIDVDHFKRYNDTYGHQQGDDCLRQVAGALSGSLHRSADVVARYGGEEFAVILPGTDASSAMTVAQRLCQNVRTLGIPHQGNEGQGQVTISVGVSSLLAADAQPCDRLLLRADQALYEAKRGGRARPFALQ